MMPSTIAPRIYCVNLFDIFTYPRKASRPAKGECGRFQQRRNTLPEVAWCTRMFRLWIERTPTSVVRNAQRMRLHVSCAPAASIIAKGNHQGRDGMSASVNRQILLVEKPAGKLG